MTVKGRSSRIFAMSVTAFGLTLGACSVSQTGTASRNFVAAQVTDREASEYMAKLNDLPLRFELGQFHIDLGRDFPGVAVRSTHLVRDVRNKRGDTLFVIFDDLSIASISARDFALNWKSRLNERTEYAPVMTQYSVLFVDAKGGFQKFDRLTGALLEVSNVGSGFFPSAPVAANDTHLVVASGNPSGIKGIPDLREGTVNSVPWQYPSEATGRDAEFQMVQTQPIADLESIYFVSNNGKFYGITAQTGAFRFRIDLENIGRIRTAPVLQGDVIYVGSDTQFYAISRSGDVLWTFTPEFGEVFSGPIYAMDDRVVFATAKLSREVTGGGRFSDLNLGRTTEATPTSAVKVEPSRVISVSFSEVGTPILDASGAFTRDEPYPVKTDENGKIIAGRSVIRGPKAADWSMPNQGQQVLLKTADQLFLMYDVWEIPYNRDFQTQLKRDGRVVSDEELKVVTKRVVQILDPKTGKPIADGRSTGSFDITGIDFVVGSNDPSDRALYFVTKDGHVIKGFSLK